MHYLCHDYIDQTGLSKLLVIFSMVSFLHYTVSYKNYTKSKKHDVGALFLKILKGVISTEKIKDNYRGKLFCKAPLNFGGRGLIKIEFL